MTDARTHWERADHGVLSTLHPTRGIDSVPVCFVVLDDLVAIPIDSVKPKRSMRLGRLRNLEADPRATLLVEHWDADDWSALWWVRVTLLLAEVDPNQVAELEALLRTKYPQYESGGIESVVALRRVALTSWDAGRPPGS
jgi:PPOX class probable F420-dependent enzyme